jgi:hypothetical protein
MVLVSYYCNNYTTGNIEDMEHLASAEDEEENDDVEWSDV